MVELHHITAGYNGHRVLEDLTLSFPTGQVTALLGPNGCGKSTLFKAALGLIPITSGEILLHGTPLCTLSPRQIAQQVTYLAQSRNVPNITAQKMVLHGRFPYLSYPRHYRPEDHAMAEQALRWADALSLAHRPMEQLSGGQRQKIYLAMALAQDTQTIFMDEPTTYLDISHQLEVMALLRRLAGSGRAVAVVLHDLGLALRCADQVAVLSEQRLCRLGSPDEVYSSGILNQVFGINLRRIDTPEGWQYYCTAHTQ